MNKLDIELAAETENIETMVDNLMEKIRTELFEQTERIERLKKSGGTEDIILFQVFSSDPAFTTIENRLKAQELLEEKFTASKFAKDFKLASRQKDHSFHMNNYVCLKKSAAERVDTSNKTSKSNVFAELSIKIKKLVHFLT